MVSTKGSLMFDVLAPEMIYETISFFIRGVLLLFPLSGFVIEGEWRSVEKRRMISDIPTQHYPLLHSFFSTHYLFFLETRKGRTLKLPTRQYWWDPEVLHSSENTLKEEVMSSVSNMTLERAIRSMLGILWLPHSVVKGIWTSELKSSNNLRIFRITVLPGFQCKLHIKNLCPL